MGISFHVSNVNTELHWKKRQINATMIVMDRLVTGHLSYIVTEMSPHLTTEYVPNYIEVANECYLFNIIYVVYPRLL